MTEKETSHIAIPTVFPKNESKKAQFWAWLTNKYVIPTEDDDIALVTKKELKNSIKIAVTENDTLRAEELLEAASSDVTTSHEIARRGLRVGSGEYFKLLAIRLKENSSMGEIAEKVLSIAISKYLSDLEKQLKLKPSSSEAGKLKHLDVLVDTWETDRPSSRSMGLGWVANTESFMPNIIFDVDTREKLKAFVREEMLRSSGENETFTEIVDYFLEDWTRTMRDQDIFTLTAHLDGDSLERFIFEFKFRLDFYISKSDEKELFMEFGRDYVTQFVNQFTVTHGRDMNEEYSGLYASVDKEPFVAFDPDIPFEVRCVGEIVDAKNFDVSIVEEKMTSDDDQDLRKSTIQEMVDSADKSSDFKEIRNKYARLQKKQRKSELIEWARNMIVSTVQGCSVVSLYINPDLWRMVPLVLEDTDWLQLADEYLTMTKEQEESK